MQKKKASFKHKSEYCVLKIYLGFLRILPDFILKRNSSIILFLLRRLKTRHSLIIRENLTSAYPDLSEPEILKLIDSVYRHYSFIINQMLILAVRKKFKEKNPPRIIDRCNIDNIIKENRGVIFFSAHFGNWELIPLLFNKHLGVTLHGLARKMNNPLIDNFVKEFRDITRCRIISDKGSIRSVLHLLSEGEAAFFLIDQNTIDREGVFVDFFSRKACAVSSVSQIHLKRGVPIVPVFLYYTEEGIVLDLNERVEFEPTGNTLEDTKNLTQRCTTIIEQMIRKYPAQWLWFHDRWKTRPHGEKNEKGQQTT